MPKHILSFSGSLRSASFNTGLIRAAMSLAAPELNITLADISALPLYNQDNESPLPPLVAELKNHIRAADGILIATPEYNRSIPGVLKNMIDWTSRPYGDSAWNGRAVATMGATAGNVGTAVAQSHLRQTLVYLNTRVMGQPEFYLSNAMEKFDNAGNLTDENTKEHLKRLLESFQKFIS